METAQPYSKEEASAGLRDIINKWLDEKPNRNINQLARNCEVSEACIRRILTNNSFPVFENVQKIINFLQPGKTHKQVLSELPSALSEHMKFQLSYLKFEEVEKFVELGPLEKNLTDFSHQVIFERACMSDGISLKETRDLFGESGIIAVENLKKADMVEVNSDYVKCKPDLLNHSPSVSLQKAFLSRAVSEFYKTNSQINYIFSINEGVSKEGYTKVMDAIEFTHKQISKIVQMHPGQIPLSVGGFMDTLTHDNLFERKGTE